MVTLFLKITDSEVEVMRVLWEAEEPLPVADIGKNWRSQVSGIFVA